MAPHVKDDGQTRSVRMREAAVRERMEKQRPTPDPKLYNNPETLPKEVDLGDIIKTIPQSVFNKNELLALKSIVVTVTSVALSMYIISVCPWYLLPLAWVFAGTAVTGMFVIGHDCGHRSFSKSNTVNDIVGLIFMTPLIYPYESWRIQHDHHHNNTNLLFEDNAWQPFQPQWYDDADMVTRFIFRMVKGPMWFIASTGHWLKLHFSLDLFTEKQRPRVALSVYSVYAFAAIAFPMMLYTLGVWGFVKFYLVPWLGFHFWLSTFTMIHHTLPHVPFLEEDEWSQAIARLHLTVHCTFPAWIDFLTHDISVHVPHHVSTQIPHYRLREAHAALKKHWGKYMHETSFSWALLWDIITKCHLFHPEKAYTPFERSESDHFEPITDPREAKNNSKSSKSSKSKSKAN